MALAKERQIDRHSRHKAVEVLHRFAYPDGARGCGSSPLDERKCMLCMVARNEHQRRALRVEDDAPAAQELHPGYAGDCPYALDQRWLEESGIAGMRGAEVQLG